MTGNVIFDAIFIFLITYAIINICYDIGDLFIGRLSRYKPKDCIVLTLSHGMPSIEMDVRMALKHSCDLKCTLVIVDEALDIDEKMILWRLTDNSNNVVISAVEDLPEKIKNIKTN